MINAYIPDRRTKILSFLLIILSVASLKLFNNFFFLLIVDYSIWAILFVGMLKSKKLLLSNNYYWCRVFLIWAFVNSIRGAFVADNYWEYKQLSQGILMCSLPLIAFYLRDPQIDAYLLKRWNKVIIPLYFFIFIWILPLRFEFWLLPFIVLYIAYFKLLPPVWKVLVLVFFIMTFMDLSARSFLIKVLLSFLAALAIYFRNIISLKFLKLIYVFIYSMSFLLLVLALTGEFNILEEMSNRSENNKDTRSFIYLEVLGDAIDNDYIFFGRTPARGNYSPFFFERYEATDNVENLNGKMERHANELVHLNILTWLGLVGVFFYSMIYFKSSYLAVFRSNSFYMKIMGLMIAFHWVYGWIEDVNTFSIDNFWLWLMIAMGLSDSFLMMKDKDFELWFKSIFNFLNNKRIVKRL